jgi:hypothetical protein
LSPNCFPDDQNKFAIVKRVFRTNHVVQLIIFWLYPFHDKPNFIAFMRISTKEGYLTWLIPFCCWYLYRFIFLSWPVPNTLCTIAILVDHLEENWDVQYCLLRISCIAVGRADTIL